MSVKLRKALMSVRNESGQLEPINVLVGDNFDSKITTKIEDDNKSSNDVVPTVKATVDYINSEDSKIKASLSDLGSELKENLSELEEKHNTDVKEIENVIVKTTRKLDALWKLNEGISYEFRSDAEEAYEKTVPAGAKMVDAKRIGGKSIVWNQMSDVYEVDCSWASSLSGFSLAKANSLKAGKYYARLRYTITSVITTGHKNISQMLMLNSIQGGLGVCLPELADLKIGEGTSGDTIISISDSAVGKFTGIYFYGYGENGFGPTARSNCTFEFIPLTAMFGSGNEPTLNECRQLFPEDYYPYTDPTIASADVDGIELVGKNILNSKIFSDVYPGRITVDENDVVTVLSHGVNADGLNMYTHGVSVDIPPGCIFTLIPVDVAGTTNARVRIVRDDESINEMYVSRSDGSLSPMSSIVETKKIKQICFNHSTFSSVQGFGYKFKLCVSKNTEGYAQYKHDYLEINEAIRSLPGYGWSAGSVYNEVDFEKKKFIQRVGRLDIGLASWTYNATYFTAPLFYVQVSERRSASQNCIGETPYAVANGSVNSIPDKSIDYTGNTTYIYVRDDALTSVDALKATYLGKYIYYELAEPIITDISDLIPDGFLEALEVEAGGTITFHQADATKHLPVPNEEEYLISLAEVSA